MNYFIFFVNSTCSRTVMWKILNTFFAAFCRRRSFDTAIREISSSNPDFFLWVFPFKPVNVFFLSFTIFLIHLCHIRNWFYSSTSSSSYIMENYIPYKWTISNTASNKRNWSTHKFVWGLLVCKYNLYMVEWKRSKRKNKLNLVKVGMKRFFICSICQ